MALVKDALIGSRIVTQDGRIGRIVRGGGKPPKGFAFIEFEGAPILVSLSMFEVISTREAA